MSSCQSGRVSCRPFISKSSIPNTLGESSALCLNLGRRYPAKLSDFLHRSQQSGSLVSDFPKSPKAIRWKRRPLGRRITARPRRALALGSSIKMLRPRINQPTMFQMTPQIVVTQPRPDRIPHNIFNVPIKIVRILNPMLRISPLPNLTNRLQPKRKPALDELNCFF